MSDSGLPTGSWRQSLKGGGHSANQYITRISRMSMGVCRLKAGNVLLAVAI